MHFHRYTPRKALRMLLRPVRRLAWRWSSHEIHDWTQSLALNEPRVTLVVAHPDDEVFCSGLICALADRGAEITLACFTRGEGGITEEVKITELAALRESELRKAADILGIKELHFLGYIDPVPRRGTCHEPEHDPATLSSDLRALFVTTEPDLIITHGSSGEYWHPGHILLHDYVRSAAPTETTLVSFNAFNAEHPIPEIINEDDRADFRCDARPYAERRERALRCHESQLGVFAIVFGSEKLPGRASYWLAKKLGNSFVVNLITKAFDQIPEVRHELLGCEWTVIAR